MSKPRSFSEYLKNFLADHTPLLPEGTFTLVLFDRMTEYPTFEEKPNWVNDPVAPLSIPLTPGDD